MNAHINFFAPSILCSVEGMFTSASITLLVDSPNVCFDVNTQLLKVVTSIESWARWYGNILTINCTARRDTKKIRQKRVQAMTCATMLVFAFSSFVSHIAADAQSSTNALLGIVMITKLIMLSGKVQIRSGKPKICDKRPENFISDSEKKEAQIRLL